MLKGIPKGAMALIVAVVVLSGMLFFYRLGAEPLQDYDEATYAEVVHESFTNHDFLSLHFLDVNYFRKPPLLFWVMGASESAVSSIDAALHRTVSVSDRQLADRIPAALAGFLTIIAVIVMVYAATGNAYAAAFGGAILLATGAFLEPSREVRFDTLASLFDMLAVLAFFKARTSRVWLVWLGAFVGLAIMAKGPLVLYAIAAIVAAATVLKGWSVFKSRYGWGGLLALLAIVLPWHIFETIKFGWSFWQQYVGVQVLDRVAGPLFTVSTTNASYFQYILGFAAPWAVLFLLTLVVAIFRRRFFTTEMRAWYVASVAGMAAVAVVCVITKTKAITYLIPLYPFMALAVTVSGYALYAKLHGIWRRGFVALALVFLTYGLWLSAYNGLHLNPIYDTEANLAWEEKGIANYLVAVHASQFSVYDVTTLGNIMYYTGIVQPAWPWDGEQLTPGIYVLYQTAEAQKLQAVYPSARFSPLVTGPTLSLAKVLAS